MTQDPVAFRRATAVCLAGLALQLVTALALVVYGTLTADRVAVTAFLYVAPGALIWITLALLYHQHRLERLEAAELEALTAREAEGAASIFDEAPEDLQVAARRLAWMHRYLSPVMSLLVAGLYIGFGALRLTVEPPAEAWSTQPGWGVGVGFLLAAAGFIFARFVAGMAGHEVWALLRGGASAAIGAALTAALLGAGHALGYGGMGWLMAGLHKGLPVAMIVLGGEILFNFLLNLYRPRRPGEAPRPAFDSRLLSFLAAPDRIAETISEAINYQFGFDVSSTWFYQLLSRWTVALLTLAAAVLWLLTVFVVVEPNEQALILRSGSLVREAGPGLHLKAPWPVGSVVRRPARAVNTISLRQTPLDESAPVVWTEPHVVGQERYHIVRASSGEPGAGDLALLGADLVVQYEVVDLKAYYLLAGDSDDPDDPDALRRGVLEETVKRQFLLELGSRSVDEVLGQGRLELVRSLRRGVERAWAALNPDPQTGQPLGAGVRVLAVNLQAVHPPSEKQVAQAFHNVVDAQQRRLAAISKAQAEQVRTLARSAGRAELARRIVRALDELEQLAAAGGDEQAVAAQEKRVEALLGEAGGDAASLIAKARADRWRAHMDARARAARQQGRALAYKAAPYVYTAMLYLQTLRDVLADARVFITTFDTSDVQFDFTEMQPSFDPFELRRANQEQP